MRECCYIFHLFLLSCSYSSVEFIHGASSDAMHTVCDSLLNGQTLLPLWPFFNKLDHPGLQSCNWPQCSPGPTSVSMVTRGHLLSLPGGVQRATEFGCSAQCKDHPSQISEHPAFTTAAFCIQHLYIRSEPLIPNFKTIFSFLPLCSQTRGTVQ